jgi:hypothetical protein
MKVRKRDRKKGKNRGIQRNRREEKGMGVMKW